MTGSSEVKNILDNYNTYFNFKLKSFVIGYFESQSLDIKYRLRFLLSTFSFDVLEGMQMFKQFK